MTEEKLVRGIGRWDLTAIAINTIIGTGIFILPAKAFGLIGSYSLFAIIACAFIAGGFVWCYAEVSSRFDETGGMYLYAKRALGPIVGFEIGWLYWVVRIATFAANCNALLIYLKIFYPSAEEGLSRTLLILLVVGSMTAVNIIGVRQSSKLTNIFTIGKILPLLVFVSIGAFFVQPTNFSFGELPTHTSFTEAILLLIYAFVGFEAAVIPAGESKNPKKDLPFALLTALIFCGLLYILIQFVAIGTLPELANSKTPIADASGLFLGGFGAIFISVGVLISILGNLNGGFLAASRLPYAMAVQKELPELFAKTHESYRTPWISILLTSVAALVLTLVFDFFQAVVIATITRLIVYASTCVALLVFRHRDKSDENRFTKPFGVSAAYFSLAIIVWLVGSWVWSLWNKGIQGSFFEVATLVGATIVGFVIYFGYNMFSNRDNRKIPSE